MRFGIASLLFALVLWISPRTHAAGGVREVFQHENVLGTSLELKVAVASSAEANRAEAVALAEIDRLAGILSTYDPRSEVSRWLATTGQVTRLSPELAEVLGLFDLWRERTGGALNPAAEAANRLWKAASGSGVQPATDVLRAVAADMGRPHWTLNAATREAVHLDATPIALNSLTKSYILGRVADVVLRSGAARGVVVNLGGDLVVRGDWTETVAVTDPAADEENSPALRRIKVADRAVATSGRYRRGVSVGGRWHSHVIDPRTGRTADAVASATVVAADAAQAGALATAFCVLAPEESLRLAAGLPGVDCLLVGSDGRQVASPGWLALESPRVQVATAGDLPVAAPAGGGRAWDTNLELVVTLEVARIDGGRARRPFVAVWVEDQDKFPVRTIALWFKGSRWLPDLRGWHHSDQLRAITDGTDLTASVSSATRSPGKYTLRWDGRDDKGAPVKPGRYTVYIEAAREHGTHQLMRQEFTFDGTPQRVELKGNPEIAGATLDYRRKAAAP